MSPALITRVAYCLVGAYARSTYTFLGPGSPSTIYGVYQCGVRVCMVPVASLGMHDLLVHVHWRLVSPPPMCAPFHISRSHRLETTHRRRRSQWSVLSLSEVRRQSCKATARVASRETPQTTHNSQRTRIARYPFPYILPLPIKATTAFHLHFGSLMPMGKWPNLKHVSCTYGRGPGERSRRERGAGSGESRDGRGRLARFCYLNIIILYLQNTDTQVDTTQPLGRVVLLESLCVNI